MNDTQVQKTDVVEQVLTPDIVKGEILLALTAAEQSIQLLHTAKSKLVFNEDNLENIKKYLDDCDKAAKKVEAERVKKGRPFYDKFTTVNAGAKLVSTEIEGLVKDVNTTYQKLCREADEKRAKAKAAEERENGIRQNMGNFKTDMAVRVAAAEKYADLVALERLMNLETANKARYAEFQEEFKNDVKALSGLISGKKIAAREREGLGLDGQGEAENKPDEQILADMEQKEGLDTKIAEINTKLVETAVNQASKPTDTVKQVFAMIPKGGRKLWRWELLPDDVDENGKIIEGSALKKATKGGMTKVVIDEEKVDARLKEIRESENEITENGIRYYIFKKF